MANLERSSEIASPLDSRQHFDVWQYTHCEIERIRLNRRVQRLERRLADLRRSQTELHRDTINVLGAELTHLRDQAGGGRGYRNVWRWPGERRRNDHFFGAKLE